MPNLDNTGGLTEYYLESEVRRRLSSFLQVFNVIHHKHHARNESSIQIGMEVRISVSVFQSVCRDSTNWNCEKWDFFAKSLKKRVLRTRDKKFRVDRKNALQDHPLVGVLVSLFVSSFVQPSVCISVHAILRERDIESEKTSTMGYIRCDVFISTYCIID